MKLNFKISLASIIFFIIIGNQKSHGQMFWNQACTFAGNANSYISRESNGSLNLMGSFTIEAWINPTTPGLTQPIFQKREGNNAFGFGVHLHNGKVAVRTNGITRLIGSEVVPANTWTHIEVTYSSSFGLFAILLNGVTDETVFVGGAAPIASTDSLFAGKDVSGSFNGHIDEIRLWNRNLSSSEISQFMRTSLGTNSGVYNGLVLSLTFQQREAAGAPFTLEDQSGNSNNFVNKGVSALSLSNRPSKTISINDCAELNGNNEYLACPDGIDFSPLSSVTLEAWIFPKSFNTTDVVIHKGSDNGASTDYGLRLDEGYPEAIINNQIVLTSDNLIPLNQWTHVAFTHNGIDGTNTFYINGKPSDNSTEGNGLINNGNDSFYVGGTIALNDFEGYIDEVRIKNIEKSYNEINQFLYRSIDESIDLAGTEAVFNLDGYTVSSTGSADRLYFRNSANFAHAGTQPKVPQAPLNRNEELNFQDGYNIKTTNRRIPEAGTSGFMTTDSFHVAYNEIVVDLNVFVALNHSDANDITITLVSPFGLSAVLHSFQTTSSGSGNLVTIYNDQADSSLNNSGYVSFAPVIKPANNLNTAFSGTNTSGTWKLIIEDVNANDTGRLYAWGIQVNNKFSKNFIMSANTLIQGFYDISTNDMIRDTVWLKFRNGTSPYGIVDSAKSYIASSGNGNYLYNDVYAGEEYYIQVKHRNSIETWSSAPVIFDPLTSQIVYNFSNAPGKSFGNNMIQIDDSPVRYGIYNGDATQDGNIDLSDIIFIYNDANNFASGYLRTDITGDGFVDLSDLTVTINNSNAFISVIRP